MSHPSSSPMGERPVQHLAAERVVFFTDAIVAIAITLLVLPLLESIPESAARGLSTGQWLGDHVNGLFAFVASFVIVAYSWMSHRRLFSQLNWITSAILWLDIAWALCIVFLQLPSAMIYLLPTDRWSPVLYIGTLTVAQALITAMSWLIGRTPDLLEPGATMTVNTRVHLAVTGLFLLCLVVALVAPGIGFMSLFLLWLAPFARRVPWIAAGRTEHSGLIPEESLGER